jgi:hypothetical protein
MSNNRFSFDLPEDQPTKSETEGRLSDDELAKKGAIPGLLSAEEMAARPINLECYAEWTDQELADDLKQVIDPDKTYRARMPDTSVWFQTSGKNWLILIPATSTHAFEEAVKQIEGRESLVVASLAETAVKQLFEWMRHHVTLKDPSIRRMIEHLEFPPKEGLEPYWDGSEEIIEL